MSKLRFGMIGGGEGSFIGQLHLEGAQLDGLGELAAGCFSRDYGKSLDFGRRAGLDEDRIYRTYEEMAAAEAARPDPIDFVIVAAPNHIHYDCCRAFLENGIHVVCDKPLTNELQQAKELKALARKKDLLFAVTYVYSAMPAAWFMKEQIAAGRIGRILRVKGEYLSDNLLAPNEELDSGMLWRIDPAKAGKSTCCADIGVHCQQLITYVTGLSIRELSADMTVVGEGRQLDTDFTASLHFDSGAKGHMWCSNVAAGRYNDLNIAVYGTKGSLSWSLEEPDIVKMSGDTAQTICCRVGKSRESGEDAPFRLPAGQSEGWVLAFANIYRAFMTALIQQRTGQPLQKNYPGIDDGIAGVAFVDACVRSWQAQGQWTAPQSTV